MSQNKRVGRPLKAATPGKRVSPGLKITAEIKSQLDKAVPLGRALKAATPGKRVSLGLKVTAEIKSQLDKAAHQSGRTQSQEAEFRLERSFLDQQAMIEALELTFDRVPAGILLMIGEVMKETGQSAGFRATYTIEGSRNWWNNPYAFAQAMQAAIAVLDAMKPEGDPTPPRITTLQTADKTAPGIDLNTVYANLGRGFANSILEEAATGHTRSSGNVERARRLHRLLGPLAERLSNFTTPEFRDADSHIGDDQ